MSEKVYRTAIYARLSRDDGDKEESNSITSQKLLCEDYIKQHRDLELVETFVDDGYSGVNFDRPAFKKMEQAMREGRIEAAVAKDLSRITRNYIDGGRYLEKVFPELGIRFIAINDGYDSLESDSQSDSIIIPFKNLINDTYCKDISVKIRTNLDAKRKRGDFVGSQAPYGYMKSADNRNRLVVDEYAAGIVKKIFAMYKDGNSIGEIVEKLDSMGVLSPMEYKISKGINYSTAFRRGNVAKWSYLAVKRILTNEVYMGMLAQGKRMRPNYKVHEVKQRDEADWIRVENTHEALVSYDDFVNIRRLLERDMRITCDGNERNHYSGFLFCGDCGAPLTRKAVNSGKKKYYYYICSAYKKHEGCTSHSISSIQVDRAVSNTIKNQIDHVVNVSEALEKIESMYSGMGLFDYEAQIAGIEEEIERCKRMKLKLYEDLSEGIIDRKEYSEFRNRYTDEIENKEQALIRVKKEQKDVRLGNDAEKVWVTVFKENRNFEQVDRRVLMSMVDKIFVYEKHAVEVVFRYKDEYLMASQLVDRYASMEKEVV